MKTIKLLGFIALIFAILPLSVLTAHAALHYHYMKIINDSSNPLCIIVDSAKSPTYNICTSANNDNMQKIAPHNSHNFGRHGSKFYIYNVNKDTKKINQLCSIYESDKSHNEKQPNPPCGLKITQECASGGFHWDCIDWHYHYNVTISN